MAETWFTSDFHFGHARIMEFCPQRLDYLNMRKADVPTMNERLVELWNDTVGARDTVYFLGDFAMGKIDESLTYADRLKGEIHLFWGNHDRPHYCNFKRSEDAQWSGDKYRKHLDWVNKYAAAGFKTQRLDGFHPFGADIALLNHFPYEGDSHEEDRYQGFRPEDTGMVLVHGHVHDTWQVRGRQINVGLDAWGHILHESEVKALVESAYAS